MKRTMAILAVLSAGLFMATPALADHAFLVVTADHLGDGLVQYTLTAVNETPGSATGNAIAVEIRALSLTGNPFNQIQGTIPVFLGGTGAPQDIDTFATAQAADGTDPAGYGAADGLNKDSYWDTTIVSTPNPPFGGAQGGAIGSSQYDFSAGSPALGFVSSTRIGQLVVFDPAAASLSIGPHPVVPSGIAQFSLVDARPAINGPSLIAASGANFPINGTFAVVPEPSTLALLGIGLMALTVLIRRR